MKFYKSYLLFIFINFSALGIGIWLMNDGPKTEWYTNLNQAPWTPPGWVFGVAWSSIMLLFSVYMTYLIQLDRSNKVLMLFSVQFVLNIFWNYLFFNKQEVFIALISITLLTALIFFLFFHYFKEFKKVSYLLLPYMIWLCIATSLNLYILIHN